MVSIPVGSTVRYTPRVSGTIGTKIGTVIEQSGDYAKVDFGDGRLIDIFHHALAPVTLDQMPLWVGGRVLVHTVDGIEMGEGHITKLHPARLVAEVRFDTNIEAKDVPYHLITKIKPFDVKAAADEIEFLTNPLPIKVNDQGEYEFVNAPKHYNDHPSGVECQEIIRECKDPMIAFAIKHLWRSQFGTKPGQSGDQDLAKAIEYIQLEQARRAGAKRL